MDSPAQSIFPQSVPYTTILLGLCLWMGMPAILSAEPPAPLKPTAVPLEQIQGVLIEALALTERGLQDSTGIHQAVSARLAQAGFTPAPDDNMPHDITVRGKCEERKTRTGLSFRTRTNG